MFIVIVCMLGIISRMVSLFSVVLWKQGYLEQLGHRNNCKCVESHRTYWFSEHCRSYLEAKHSRCLTYQPLSNHHQLENKLRNNFLGFRKSLVFLLLLTILTLLSTWPLIFKRNKLCGGDKYKLTFSSWSICLYFFWRILGMASQTKRWGCLQETPYLLSP